MTYHIADTTNTLNASISSYDDTFLLCACIAIIGIVFSLMIRKPKAIVVDNSILVEFLHFIE